MGLAQDPFGYRYLPRQLLHIYIYEWCIVSDEEMLIDYLVFFYSNFVIQFIIELEDSHFIREICSEVAEHLAELSLHKTGSYVVQRCLESSEGRLLLQKLANFTDEVLEQISTHPFGNYVMQTALKVEKVRWWNFGNIFKFYLVMNPCYGPSKFKIFLSANRQNGATVH